MNRSAETSNDLGDDVKVQVRSFDDQNNREKPRRVGSGERRIWGRLTEGYLCSWTKRWFVETMNMEMLQNLVSGVLVP